MQFTFAKKLKTFTMRQIVQTSFLATFLTLVALFSSQLVNAQRGVDIEERIKLMTETESKVEAYIAEMGGYSYWGSKFLEASVALRGAFELYGDAINNEELETAKRNFAYNAYYFWKSIMFRDDLKAVLGEMAFWYSMH